MMGGFSLKSPNELVIIPNMDHNHVDIVQSVQGLGFTVTSTGRSRENNLEEERHPRAGSFAHTWPICRSAGQRNNLHYKC